MEAEPKISVVVCTRNRVVQLVGALEAMSRMQFRSAWELIIVDNNSTDDTRERAEEAIVKYRLPGSVIAEPVPGLSRARNRGISAAKAQIIVFTDDDCYVEEDYLECIDEVFSDPTITFAGGRVLLFDETDLPITIQPKDFVEHYPPGSYIGSGQILGANMAFRRDALLEIRGFDERLGAGTFFKSGEDTDVLRRLLLSGHSGIYSPKMLAYHHHGRKTVGNRVAYRTKIGEEKLVLRKTRGDYAF